MVKEYTAEEVLKIIKNCGDSEEKHREAYELLEKAIISEEELEKLLDNEEYNIFYLKCYRAFEE